MFGKNNLYKIDYALVFVVIAIIFIGILMIYSAGFDPVEKVNNGLYKKQILWFVIGFVLMVSVMILNYQYLGDYTMYVYGFLLFLLIITTLFGKPIRNTRAWLTLGYFSLQPSEFMKLGLVLIMAKYLELRERDMKKLGELVIPTLLAMVPVVIILFQPDFGTAMIFVPLFFTLLFVGGADVLHLMSVILIAVIALFVPIIVTYNEWTGGGASGLVLGFFKNYRLIFSLSGVLILIAGVSFALSYFLNKKVYRRLYIPSFVVSAGLMLSVIIQLFLKDYQKKRILVFLNPDLDPHGSGYNVIQSKIAIGSGGFFGKGFLNGSQSQLGFLPEKTSDFIFSVVAEEWGFFGALVVIVLLCLVVLRAMQIAIEAKDKFGAIVASGISAIFFFHILINVGMVIGIMPVTGLPLCFVSYGGSNLIMSMIAVGILINIRMRKFVY
jgi:rod shape determining protein RodA